MLPFFLVLQIYYWIKKKSTWPLCVEIPQDTSVDHIRTMAMLRGDVKPRSIEARETGAMRAAPPPAAAAATAVSSPSALVVGGRRSGG